MTVLDYFQKYGFNFTSDLLPEINEVREEASEHLYRSKVNDLVSKKRPAESETVKDWRRSNKRYINHEIFETALWECKTNISQTGFNFNQASEILNTWIKDTRFKYLKTDVDIFDYYLNYILPLAITDPNSYILAVPVNPLDRESPPALMDSFLQVEVELKYFESKKVVKPKTDLNSDSVIIVQGGMVKIDKKYYVWYWASNENELYKVVPISLEQGAIKYDLVLWYTHNLERSPFVILPGRLSKSMNGYLYQESLFKPAIPYLNEFVNSFSDDQWMRLKNNYATLVLPEVNCSYCGGEKFIPETPGSSNMKLCTTCAGTGKLKAPGISEFLTLPPSAGFDGKSDTRQPYYLAPDMGSLTHSWETTFDLLDKAAATLGINPLIKNSESGEAMKMRMDKLNKTINSVYQASASFLESVFEIVEGYLVYQPEKRKKPKLKVEYTVILKSPEYLKEVYKTSLPIEKTQAIMDYLSTKYASEPIQLRKYEILARYYPQTLLEPDEVRDQIAFGVITEEDIKRGKFALQKIEELIEVYRDTFTELGKEAVYKLIEDANNQG